MAIDIQIIDNSEMIKLASKDQLIAALEDVGQQAEDNVADITPIDTGRLAGSISHTVISDKQVCVGTNVEYAPYVEFGTSRQKPQPYLRPGIMNNVSEYRSIVEEHLKS